VAQHDLRRRYGHQVHVRPAWAQGEGGAFREAEAKA
jgi:hypothetical protein